MKESSVGELALIFSNIDVSEIMFSSAVQFGWVLGVVIEDPNRVGL